jgi:hypothetical protein
MFNPHTFLMLSCALNLLSTASYLWAGDYPRAWYFGSAASRNLCLWLGFK